MQTNVATLLFATSAIILAYVVVDYTVVIFEQTLDTEDTPKIDRIQKLENMILNQTDDLINEIESLNQTDTQSLAQTYP